MATASVDNPFDKKYIFEGLNLFMKNGEAKAAICVANSALSFDKILFRDIKGDWIGPVAVGGIREKKYLSQVELIEDCLKLADAMALKISLLHLPFGGAKMTVASDIADTAEESDKIIGSCINLLKGRYIGAQDVNISLDRLIRISKCTPFVVGLPIEMGGAGDPSYYTKNSVMASLRALLEFLRLEFQDNDYSKIKFLVHGLGAVGGRILEDLYNKDARIVASDADRSKTGNFKKLFPEIKIVESGKELEEEFDIYVPAIPAPVGGIFNLQTLPLLKCKAVCGPSNNQCGNDFMCGYWFQERNIIYVPDFLANNGGINAVLAELDPGGFQYNKEWVFGSIERNYLRTKNLLEEAARMMMPPVVLALTKARENIAKAEASLPPHRNKMRNKTLVIRYFDLCNDLEEMV